ncbi:MAG: helix-turn-helix domain-containing protein [Leifsonia sp.]
MNAGSTGETEDRSGESKRLRQDAEQNRLAILTAAERTFAERGTGVRLDEIAREAGVGVATLYRRFPQREDLIEAVLGARMTAYADRSAVEAARSLTEPWEALRSFVLYLLEQQATDRAFNDVLIAPLTGSTVFVDEHRRALRSMTRLVERVKAAGVVRADFEHSDLYLLMLSNAGLLRAAGTTAPDAWRRLGAYMLDGFRVKNAAPLPAVGGDWT